jgi:hypothetical protein
MLFASTLCPLLCSVRPPARAQRLLCCDVAFECTLSVGACCEAASACAASVGACGDAACVRTVSFSACYAAAFARTAPVSACCEAVCASTASAAAGYDAARAHTTSFVGACRGPAYVLSASLCSRCGDTAGTSLQLLVLLGVNNRTILAVCTLHNFSRTPGPGEKRILTFKLGILFCFCVVFTFLPFPGSESLNSVHSNNNQRSTDTIADARARTTLHYLA